MKIQVSLIIRIAKYTIAKYTNIPIIENVSRKRKSSETTSAPAPVGRRGSNAPVTR